MRVFITGGTGFIGRNTVNRFTQTDHEICCLVRKQSDADELNEMGIRTVRGDIRDKMSLISGMKDHDCVLNIAAAYNFWMPNRKIYREVNVLGVRNVMEAVLETGVSKVVHISTIAIYGKPSESPFSEKSALGPIRFSEYSQTKYEGDMIAWDMFRNDGLPLVVIYPGAVLGPDDPKPTGEYIQNLIERRLPAIVFENALFPWVHVRDVAEAILRAAEKKNNVGEKYIIAKCNLTFGEINRMISELAAVPLPAMRMPDMLAMMSARMLTALANLTKKPPLWGMAIDQMRLMKEGAAVDGSKAERELGIAYTPIETAIEEAVRSYRVSRR